MWLAYWTIRAAELSDNKLSDNNLASELVENGSFFKPIIIEEIVIFMVIKVNKLFSLFFVAVFSKSH